MEEVEATLFDGDTVIVEGISVLLDVPDLPVSPADAAEWHAHAALPLSLILQPGEQMRLEITDGRSGPVVILGSPTIEGDRALHVFTGIGPLVKSGA